MSTTTEFLNSVENYSNSTIPATSNHPYATMIQLRRLWYQMFVSTLVSSIILHSIGSLVLFIRLRKHMFTKWLIIVILIAGVVTPLVLGSINNILIASILVYSGRYDLTLPWLILIGLCQTMLVVLIGFLKILQTL